MKEQFTFRATMVIALMAICIGVLNAQQTKRNLVANSDFEDGLKHWRWDGADIDGVLTIEELSPISGARSAKIEVLQNTVDAWNTNLYYFMPIEEYAKYRITFKAKASIDDARFRVEVCESHGNHTGFKPINLEKWEEDFVIDNPEINDLRGVLSVGTQVREYEFITDGSQFAYPNYTLAFHFGHATLATYWIDDIKVSRVDEGDWDGNLFPVGNFESDRERVGNSQGYFIDGRTSDPESVAYIDTEYPVSGNKSFYIYKSPGQAANEDFWSLSYNFQFWMNDAPKLDIALKAKSTKETKLMMRLQTAERWGYAGGDIYQWEIPVTTNLQELKADRNNAVSFVGSDYLSTSLPAFKWDAEDRAHRGRYSLFGSLLDHNITPQDVGIWIDDVVIKEGNLFLEKFTVDYAPATLAVGQTKQFKIAELVYPTHAPATVDFWVDNQTGVATIDENGVLTGVSVGTVDVYIDTPNMTDEKKFTVQITQEDSGLEDLNSNVIELSRTLLTQGGLIEIKAPLPLKYTVSNLYGVQVLSTMQSNYIRTDTFVSGVYLVNIELENGVQAIRKFIVK